MLAIGYDGPMLLEDAVDIAYMAIKLNKAVPPSQWVDEWRRDAEISAFSCFGV